MELSPEDRRAIRELRDGSEAALAYVMTRFAGYLCRIQRFIVHRDVFAEYRDEWLQDVWYSVWRRRATIRPEDNFVKWLALVAFTCGARFRKRASRRKRIPKNHIYSLDSPIETNDGVITFQVRDDSAVHPFTSVATIQELRFLLENVGPEDFWLLWDFHVLCDGELQPLSRLHRSCRKSLRQRVRRAQANAASHLGIQRLEGAC